MFSNSDTYFKSSHRISRLFLTFVVFKLLFIRSHGRPLQAPQEFANPTFSVLLKFVLFCFFFIADYIFILYITFKIFGVSNLPFACIT